MVYNGCWEGFEWYVFLFGCFCRDIFVVVWWDDWEVVFFIRVDIFIEVNVVIRKGKVDYGFFGVEVIEKDVWRDLEWWWGSCWEGGGWWKLRGGIWGLFLWYVWVGDKIGVVKGCWILYVLRGDGEENRWEVVGEVFVEGVMRGEEVSGMGNIVFVWWVGGDLVDFL